MDAFCIFCNDSYVGQRSSHAQAHAAAVERQMKFPHSTYTVKHGRMVGETFVPAGMVLCEPRNFSNRHSVDD